MAERIKDVFEVIFRDAVTGEERAWEPAVLPALRTGETLTVTWDTKGNASIELDSHETLPPAAEPE